MTWRDRDPFVRYFEVVELAVFLLLLAWAATCAVR
jgi:hypothetical protein